MTYTGRCACGSVTLALAGEPHGLMREVVIWTEEAPTWVVIDPALASWPRQPPTPAPAQQD